MNKILNWKFLLILFVAVFLRFYQLGINPPSLTWDEASWGYNAYSLGIDGKDEFGRFLPHDFLESFGDFKPPMYAYLDTFPVKMFGLNEFSTRFPSAFFGVLTVIFTYFLTKNIFYKSENRNKYALFASFVLAISPWHIMLSRAAFEANVATFFLVFGVFSFLEGIQSKKWFLILSAISFTLSMYTFNTARIIAPLLVIILAAGFRKELIRCRKETIIAIIIGVVLILPTAKFLLSPQAGLRFKEVNIFSDSGAIDTSNTEIANDNNNLVSKVLHNRRFIYASSFVNHYFDNLSPSFLFIKGDGNPKFSTQNVGQMYLWDLPFFIAGILFIFKKREGAWWIIPLWLLVAIIPAATARETPHALRVEAALPMFQIMTAVGIVIFLNFIKSVISKANARTIIFGLTFFFLLFNFAYFYHEYLTYYPQEFSGEWQYGYRDSINYILVNQNKYDQINITTELGRPYIYYLFYEKTNPIIFRKSAQITRDSFGFVSVNGFGKYKFAQNLGDIKNPSKKILYINIPKNTPSKANIIKNFYLLNGGISLQAYTL